VTYRVLACSACGLRTLVGAQSIAALVQRELHGCCTRCGGEVRRDAMNAEDNKRLGTHREGFNPRFPTTIQGRELKRLSKKARLMAAAER